MRTLEAPRSKKSYEFRCKGKDCQALMRADASEGVRVGMTKSELAFVCPHCGRSNNVEAP